MHPDRKAVTMQTAALRRIPDNYDSLDVIVELRSAVRAVLATLPLTEGARVLDYGCGTGYFSEYFYRRGFGVKGLDVDAGLIAAARRKYPHIEFEVASSRQSDLAKYDFAFLNMVICNIGGARRMTRTLRGLRNFLQAEGSMFLTGIDLNFSGSSSSNVIQQLVGKYYSGAPMTVQLRENNGTYTVPWMNFAWTRVDLEKMISNAGFTICESNYLPCIDPYYYILARP
jgi:trans-aconitate methyltransferase